MTTAEFIIALFYRIDNQMCIVPKHPQAALYPSAQRRLHWGVCMRSKAAANGRFIAGCAVTGLRFFRGCRSGRACSACGWPMPTRSMSFGRSRRR